MKSLLRWQDRIRNFASPRYAFGMLVYQIRYAIRRRQGRWHPGAKPYPRPPRGRRPKWL